MAMRTEKPANNSDKSPNENPSKNQCTLFAWPKRAYFGRAVPKTRIFAQARTRRKQKDAFAAQVAKIIWQYKLAPETLNLPAKRSVPEIQVFRVSLKPGIKQISDELLHCIDKAIPFPLLFEVVTDENRIRTMAAYKRPSEADASKWVVSDYFAGAWTPQDTVRTQLPVALDLANLYQQLLRQLMPAPARENEPLQEQVERIHRLRQLQNESRKLEARVHRERQFNRKVELNSQLRALNAQIQQHSQ